MESNANTVSTGNMDSVVSELSRRIKENIASSVLSGTVSATVIDYDTSVSVCDSLGECVNPIKRKTEINVDFSKKDSTEVRETVDNFKKEDVKSDYHEQKTESSVTEVKGSSFMHDFKVAGISFIIALFILFLFKVSKRLKSENN